MKEPKKKAEKAVIPQMTWKATCEKLHEERGRKLPDSYWPPACAKCVWWSLAEHNLKKLERAQARSAHPERCKLEAYCEFDHPTAFSPESDFATSVADGFCSRFTPHEDLYTQLLVRYRNSQK